MAALEGRVAVITGAGRGIGREHALLFAAEGASVVVNDLGGSNAGEGSDAGPAQQVVEEITAAGGKAVANTENISSWDGAKGLVQQAIDEFGRLDVLVNNAGIAIAKTIEDTTLAEWRRTMAVNLDGVFLGCQAGIGLMKKAGGGSIVNLSSIDGIIGEADLAAYCASKGGVRTLTKAVAVHCAEQKYGIRCNSIHPGYIWTPQTENYLRDLGRLEEERAKALSRHPIGFLGEPNDIAYMVLYLASDESKFVTGAEMVVDGGYLAV